MRAAGIAGVRRGKRVRTTRPDPGAPRHPDLVGRDFTATAPNQLWVTDLTYVPTWAGVAYVCFITDAYSRMIVGWRVAPPHAHHDGARCHRDGALVEGNHLGGVAMSLRCGIAIHLAAVWRASRRDRCRRRRSGPSVTASTRAWLHSAPPVRGLGGNSFSQRAALSSGEAGIAGGRWFVEPFILVVCLVGVEDSGLGPALDGARVHAEPCGESRFW